MKIINELSYSQITTNKKDTLATRLSIFLAVVLLGTIIFIIGSVKSGQYHEIVSSVGEYHVSFTDVNTNMIGKIFGTFAAGVFFKILIKIAIIVGIIALIIKLFKKISGKKSKSQIGATNNGNNVGNDSMMKWD